MIERYQKMRFDAAGISHEVYFDGSGPPVVLMHELPGMTAGCLRVSQWIIAAGFTVYLPLFFGQPEREQVIHNLITTTFCVRREFNVLTSNGSSPIAGWLRELCQSLSVKHVGRGVGIIGMCFTGNIVLSVMLDPTVRVSVMCEPALPFFHKAALGVPERDIQGARQRGVECPILAYRFSEDKRSPRERFEALRSTFGASIRTVEFPTELGNPFGLPQDAHSVLTNSFPNFEDPSHPTQLALAEILSKFKENLTL